MSFFIWNFTDILFFSIAAFITWIVAKNAPADKKWLKPYPLGLAVAFVSGFSVGLFCVITVALYVSFVYLWETMKKVKN